MPICKKWRRNRCARTPSRPSSTPITIIRRTAPTRRISARQNQAARQGLVQSTNGATVRIGMAVGLDPVLQLCRDAGSRSTLRPYPATFLGSSEVTLAELALAYTIFPNGGWRSNAPHILERIEEKDGTVVWDAKRERTRKVVIKPETAYEVHSCLVDALES